MLTLDLSLNSEMAKSPLHCLFRGNMVRKSDLRIIHGLVWVDKDKITITDREKVYSLDEVILPEEQKWILSYGKKIPP